MKIIILLLLLFYAPQSASVQLESLSTGAENVSSEKAHNPNDAPYKSANNIKEISDNSSIPIPIDIVGSGVSNNIDSNNASNQDCEKNKCPNISWWHKLKTEPVATFTALLFIATLGLWIATWRLVINTKETSSKQIRAYVSASIRDGEKMFFDKRGRLNAPITVKNYGQTPASKLKCSTFICLHKLPLNVTLCSPDYTNSSLGCLAPSQCIRTYPALHDKLSDAEVSAIESDEAGIYVWGYVKYVDVFGTEQNAKFRLVSTGSDFTRRELAYCEEGNEAS